MKLYYVLMPEVYETVYIVKALSPDTAKMLVLEYLNIDGKDILDDIAVWELFKDSALVEEIVY